ncbi:MAG: response regulator [Verrucomicrobia bacterium]|nr:response regulator [Verrucomicrobiota bacterium]MCH8512952.1 response regulator [Kiritimatiellia bacterium]
MTEPSHISETTESKLRAVPASVLIVEDEPIVARDICQELEILGYNIAGEARTGESALELAAELKPDLILMDIQLAGEMDGVTAAGIIRDEMDIPVVFLTAFAGGEIFERAKKMEPFGYILKPFEERELQIVVDMALYKHGMEKEMRFKSQALSSAANAIVITDPEGKIVWVNAAFSRYTGYSMEEALKKNPSELVKSSEQDEEFYKKMWETISRGEVWEGELVNRRKDGTTYPERMTITPMFGPAGKITHYIAIKQDITEQKKLEKLQLRSQRMESIGTLAGGIAHDLNNILSPIIMSADLLVKTCEDPEQLDMLKMISDSAQRGAEIVKQVLSFARGTDGRKSEIQIRHILVDLAKVCRETFPRKIEVLNYVPRDLWLVRADPTQIHQVLMNVLINARDAMPEGGQLTIKGMNVELNDTEDDGLPEELAPGRYVRLQIMDTGIGISEDVMKHIFDLFFTTKAQGEGTGLGLSTAMGIVRAHGGAMTVQSASGAGACFTIYLPADPTPAEKKIGTPRKKLPRGNGERILIVDDEESIRWMLKTTLDGMGYVVDQAVNGSHAMEKLAEIGPPCDLVISDVMMPVMDGAELVKALEASRPGLPVLLISGMLPEGGLEARGLELNKPCLIKPFAIADLAEKVAELLRT